MEAGQHMSRCVTMETKEMTMPTCDTETCTDSEEDKRALKKKDEEENQFASMQNGAVSSKDIGLEDGVGPAGGREDGAGPADDSGAVGPPGDNSCWSAEDGEAISPERMLQESVDKLKTLMETDVWTERWTSGPRALFLTFLLTGL